MKSLFVILSVFCFALIGNTASATPQSSPSPAAVETQESNGVFVHISAVLIKKTRKGAMVEITNLKAGKKGAKLKKNQFGGLMVLRGDQISIQLVENGKKIAGIRMPKGFKIPAELSKALGTSQSIVMSGGSTMLQPQSDSLLWFEIQ